MMKIKKKKEKSFLLMGEWSLLGVGFPEVHLSHIQHGWFQIIYANFLLFQPVHSFHELYLHVLQITNLFVVVKSFEQRQVVITHFDC